MFTITEDAAEAIRVVSQTPGMPESAGMRITTATKSLNGGGPALELELVPEPAQQDEVLEGEGAQVFLAPDAAPMVADKTLDADLEPGGGITFSLIG